MSDLRPKLLLEIILETQDLKKEAHLEYLSELNDLMIEARDANNLNSTAATALRFTVLLDYVQRAELRRDEISKNIRYLQGELEHLKDE